MKGFTHTLESIIASLFLLSSIAFIIPQVTEAELTNSRIDSLDEINLAERAGTNTTAVEILAETMSPVGFQESSFIRKTTTKTYKIESNPESNTYINLTGNNTYFHVFINEGNLNATYKGKKILENQGTGYKSFRTTKTSGFLNTTGEGSLTVEAVNQSIDGSLQNQKESNFYSYPNYNGSPYEVRLSIWS